MRDKAFIERLGYLAGRGLRDQSRDSDAAEKFDSGFAAGVIAASQSDDCPYVPDRRCSDFACNGC